MRGALAVCRILGALAVTSAPLGFMVLADTTLIIVWGAFIPISARRGVSCSFSAGAKPSCDGMHRSPLAPVAALRLRPPA